MRNKERHSSPPHPTRLSWKDDIAEWYHAQPTRQQPSGARVSAYWGIGRACRDAIPNSAPRFEYPIFRRCAENQIKMMLPPRKKPAHRGEPKVTLKTIAQHLGLTPGTVSAALNNSAAARSIPEHTKNRIIEAAKTLNYRPNFFARTLRLKRTYTIWVIADEFANAYCSIG